MSVSSSKLRPWELRDLWNRKEFLPMVVLLVIAGLLLGCGARSKRSPPDTEAGSSSNFGPSAASSEKPDANSELSTPAGAIADFEVSTAELELDKIVVSKIEVFLQGEGAGSVVVTSGTEEHKADVEDNRAVIYCSWPGWVIDRVPKQDSLVFNVTVLSSTGNVLTKRKVDVGVPVCSMGETIPDVEEYISFTPLWWKESKIAVDGPYSSGFYTFTAKPGMKFVILAYSFKNNGIRPETTPHLSAGEIVTSKGYIYPLWNPPLGIHSKEYSPRESTASEILNLIGSSGGYEKLLPKGTVKGCAVFEIPYTEKPLEIDLSKVFPIISLG